MSVGVRVPYATNDDGTLGGSSGFNGFTFPTPIGTFEDGTLNPFRMTFQDAIKCYWRVKNWALFTDIGTSGSGVSLTLGSIDFNPTSRTSEMDLIYPGSNGASGGAEDPDAIINNYGQGIAGGVSFEIFKSPNLNYRDDEPPVNPLDPPILRVCPYFDASGGIVVGTTIPGTPPFIPLLIFTTQFNADATSTITVNLKDSDGTTMGACTGYLQGINDADPDLAWTPYGSFLDITAQEFWPYAALNGTDPIYDTGSGIQLQDPLS